MVVTVIVTVRKVLHSTFEAFDLEPRDTLRLWLRALDTPGVNVAMQQCGVMLIITVFIQLSFVVKVLEIGRY